MTAAAMPRSDGMPDFPAHELLGVQVHAMTTDDLFSAVTSAVTLDRQCVIANHNAHSVHLFHRDARMRAFYALARYVFIDGAPLVHIARLLGLPIEIRHRITSLDFLRPLLALSVQQGWRVMFVGSRPGVADRAAERLRGEIPGLDLHVMHGYFDIAPGSAANAGVVAQVASLRPQLLLVGMGMPRQEQWILDNIAGLRANVIMNLGAIMDYIAGEIPTAPRWLGPIGMEWSYRLVTEPRRLGHRYLVEPWSLVPKLAQDVVRYRVRRRDPTGPAGRRPDALP